MTPELCRALLRFDTLSGCDQTGRFPGFSKKSCWNISLHYQMRCWTNWQIWIYKLSSHHSIIAGCVKDLTDGRWHTPSKQQSDSQKLPQPVKYFDKKYFERTTLLFNGNHLFFRHHHYQIHKSTDRNGIATTLILHSLQLQNQ